MEGNEATTGGGMCWWESWPDIEHCTVVANSATEGGGMACYEFAQPEVDWTIIASNFAGAAVHCANATAVPLFSCTDIWGNVGGDWAGEIAGQEGINGNFSADPLFCGPANPGQPYTLDASSPCAAENNPMCGLIGAWDVGCDSGSSVDEISPTVSIMQLMVPVPNPSTGVVRLRYAVPATGTGAVRLRIFDVGGRLVRTLIDDRWCPGFHSAEWDGRDTEGHRVEGGVYNCSLTMGGEVITRQVTLIP
jgi:hypothetical protein